MKRLLIYITLITLLSGCSSNQQESKTVDVAMQVTAPDWVEVLPLNTDTYRYVVGFGTSVESAGQNGREILAAYLNSYVAGDYLRYLESNQIDDSELFVEYIDKITHVTAGQIIRLVEVVEIFEDSLGFHTLMRLDLVKVKANHDNAVFHLSISFRLNEYKSHPQAEFEGYLRGVVPILARTVYPLYYEGVPAFIYLHDRCKSLLNDIILSHRLIYDDVSGDVNQIIISPLFKTSDHFATFFKLDGLKYKRDIFGNLYIDYLPSFGEDFEIRLKLDITSFDIGDRFNEYELERIYSLLEMVEGDENSVYIQLPFITKLAFDFVVNSDYNISDKHLTSSIIHLDLKKGVILITNLQKSNVQIEVVADVNYSSKTELGHSYETVGSVSITYPNGEKHVVSLDNISVSEGTKSYHKDREVSANMSLYKFRVYARAEVVKLLKEI